MNLIEKLGYDVVKNAALNYRDSGDALTAKKFESELLEYRREHNIFEVGDKVVRLDNKSLHIYTVQKVESETITIVRKKKSNSVKVWGMWLGCHELRHATDAEIKAGKRGGEDVVHGSTI